MLLFGLQCLALVPHVHLPAAHVLLRWALQSLPQPPQFPVLVVTSVSHPLSNPVAGLSQLPNPAAQNEVHVFPVHASAVVCVVAHARSQPPQFATSSWTTRSQPGALALVSQSP